MQHALGLRGRARGVDEERRIVGGRVGEGRARPARDHARNLFGLEHAHACGSRADAELASDGDRLRTAVLQKKAHLGLGELGRRRQRHEAARDGPEEQQRIGARIVEPDEYARAGLETSLAQTASDAQHRILELRKRPHLGRPRSLGIVDDDQGRLTATRRSGAADAVSSHVEARGKRLGGVDHFASADHQLSTL